EADAGDLRVGVDRPRHGARIDGRLVAARILRCNLALPERGVRELPVAGAVADGVDVRDSRAAMLVGHDPGTLVEVDAGGLEPEALDERCAADGDEHEIRLHGLAVPEVDGQLRAVVVDLRALLAELKRDAALRELLRELLR